MSNKLFLSITLATLSITLGACSKSDTNNGSADPVNTEVVANNNSIAGNKQIGGQVTIINGADKNMVKVRSTGFR